MWQSYWTKEAIEQIKVLAMKGYLNGSYGKKVVQTMNKTIHEALNVQGQHVVVIGSERPWIEALLLLAGTDHVTVIDYDKRPTNHPQITILTPMELSEAISQGKWPSFDSMISFSSVEHSGLGRYGDQLNPWGDLITMARAWCLLKPGARAVVGVPAGKDTICFNAHKFYGPVMFKHLFANWDQISTDIQDFGVFDDDPDCSDYDFQPLHVLEKPNGIIL